MLGMYRADWSRRIRHRFRLGRTADACLRDKYPVLSCPLCKTHKNAKKMNFITQKFAYK